MQCLRLDTTARAVLSTRVVLNAQQDLAKQCESRELPVQSQPMWKVLVVFVALIVGAILIWVNAGKAPGPSIEINGPAVIGRTGEIAVSVVTPKAALKRLEIALVQDSTNAPVFSLTQANAAELTIAGDRVSITRPSGKSVVPELKQGSAEIRVTAVRPVFFGLREASSTLTRGVDVRLLPPQIAVVSSFHYVNHGGSEAVVYRVTPPDAQSGVRVGNYEYPGYPASGAGIASSDPALRVAFFALL